MTDPFTTADAIDRSISFFVYSHFWTVLFTTLRVAIFRKEPAEFSNRLVSIAHNFIALTFCFANFDPSSFLADYGGRNLPWQATAMTVSGSYFFYDTFSTAYADLEATGKIDWASAFPLPPVPCLRTLYP